MNYYQQFKHIYNSERWKKLRKEVRERDKFICQHCHKIVKGRGIVHHKIHITKKNMNDEKVTFNPDNLEYLCQDCHNKHHKVGSKEKFVELEQRQDINLF